MTPTNPDPVAAAIEALEPFAAVNEINPDGDDVWDAAGVTVKLGDLRRARVALASLRSVASAPADSGWKCKANPRAVVPSDCGWPDCGCDPHVARVMEGLRECGWISAAEVWQLEDKLRADQSGVIDEIAAERRRQTEAEGWSAEHDDGHTNGALADAAACYARGTATFWPWDPAWWKPSATRRNLVKAGALIVAEIERLDRCAKKVAKPKHSPHPAAPVDQSDAGRDGVIEERDLPLFWQGRANALKIVNSRRDQSDPETVGQIQAYQECADELRRALKSHAKGESVGWRKDDPQIDIYSTLKCVRGCATDDQFRELMTNVERLVDAVELAAFLRGRKAGDNYANMWREQHEIDKARNAELESPSPGQTPELGREAVIEECAKPGFEQIIEAYLTPYHRDLWKVEIAAIRSALSAAPGGPT